MNDSQQKTEGISPTAHRELNDANHHITLEEDPSPADSPDLANTSLQPCTVPS